jgi:hypothetical protein
MLTLGMKMSMATGCCASYGGTYEVGDQLSLLVASKSIA